MRRLHPERPRHVRQHPVEVHRVQRFRHGLRHRRQQFRKLHRRHRLLVPKRQRQLAEILNLVPREFRRRFGYDAPFHPQVNRSDNRRRQQFFLHPGHRLCQQLQPLLRPHPNLHGRPPVARQVGKLEEHIAEKRLVDDLLLFLHGVIRNRIVAHRPHVHAAERIVVADPVDGVRPHVRRPFQRFLHGVHRRFGQPVPQLLQRFPHLLQHADVRQGHQRLPDTVLLAP